MHRDECFFFSFSRLLNFLFLFSYKRLSSNLCLFLTYLATSIETRKAKANNVHSLCDAARHAFWGVLHLPYSQRDKTTFFFSIIGNPLFDLLSIPGRAGFPCRWIFSSLFFFCSSLYDNWSNWSRRDTKKEKWNGRNGCVLSDRAVKGSRETREICQTYAWCMGGWLLVRFDFWGKDSPDLDKGLHLT